MTYKLINPSSELYEWITDEHYNNLPHSFQVKYTECVENGLTLSNVLESIDKSLIFDEDLAAEQIAKAVDVKIVEDAITKPKPKTKK
jgi:hypothetical protein